jgi:hypothetical protein
MNLPTVLTELKYPGDLLGSIQQLKNLLCLHWLWLTLPDAFSPPLNTLLLLLYFFAVQTKKQPEQIAQFSSVSFGFLLPSFPSRIVSFSV